MTNMRKSFLMWSPPDWNHVRREISTPRTVTEIHPSLYFRRKRLTLASAYWPQSSVGIKLNVPNSTGKADLRRSSGPFAHSINHLDRVLAPAIPRTNQTPLVRALGERSNLNVRI
jgi:hypothetical protein